MGLRGRALGRGGCLARRAQAGRQDRRARCHQLRRPGPVGHDPRWHPHRQPPGAVLRPGPPPRSRDERDLRGPGHRYRQLRRAGWRIPLGSVS